MATVRKKGDWLVAKIHDELVMMSVEQGTYLGLSDVGARIWELIETTQDTGEICRLLVEEFDVESDVCQAEVQAFLSDLAEHGAVTLES